jgi:hypothetical protein
MRNSSKSIGFRYERGLDAKSSKQGTAAQTADFGVCGASENAVARKIPRRCVKTG